jgi:hypothetical protein
MVSKIEGLMDRIAKVASPTLMSLYGMQKDANGKWMTGEFVAEVISSPKLQSELAKLEGAKGIVDKVKQIFKYAIGKYLGKGKDTILAEALELSYESMLVDGSAEIVAQAYSNEEVGFKAPTKEELDTINPAEILDVMC